MIAAGRNVPLQIQAQRRANRAGAGQAHDKSTAAFKLDPQALVFGNRAIDRVSIGKIIRHRHCLAAKALPF